MKGVNATQRKVRKGKLAIHEALGFGGGGQNLGEYFKYLNIVVIKYLKVYVSIFIMDKC